MINSQLSNSNRSTMSKPKRSLFFPPPGQRGFPTQTNKDKSINFSNLKCSLSEYPHRTPLPRLPQKSSRDVIVSPQTSTCSEGQLPNEVIEQILETIAKEVVGKVIEKEKRESTHKPFQEARQDYWKPDGIQHLKLKAQKSHNSLQSGYREDTSDGGKHNISRRMRATTSSSHHRQPESVCALQPLSISRKVFHDGFNETRQTRVRIKKEPFALPYMYEDFPMEVHSKKELLEFNL